MAGGLRYAGFITYADADEGAAVWLSRNLEAYRVPDALVGWEGPTGTIGKRIGAFFRKAEGPQEGELAADVRAALDASHALIVVRPLFDASQGAQETAEIRYFKSLGRANRLMTAVVGDELGAASESFVWRKLADGNGHDAPEAAPGDDASKSDGPIVADFRGGARERDAARLKIVSALLGVGHDELVARERTVRRGRAARFAAAAGIVIGVAGGGLTAITLTNPPRETPSVHARETSEPVDVAQSAGQPEAAAARPAAAPPRPTQVAKAVPRPAAPAVAPPRPTQVAKAAPRPTAPAAAPPRPTQVAKVATRPPAPAVAPPRPTRAAAAAPRPAAPVAAPPRPTQVATAPPAAPVAAPPRPTQVAAASPPPAAPPRPAAPPTPQATIVPVSADVGPQPGLLQQLRELGGAQSAAVRCQGSADQASRDRARRLIAANPQPHQAALIGAYNEGYRAAEGRAGACPVEPAAG